MKTFFTTGIAPWTSYNPILWLKVIRPNKDPGTRAANERKKIKSYFLQQREKENYKIKSENIIR